MAIKIYEQFAPFANPADGDHPYGSFKNDSIPGAEDGTPLDAVWANDYAGFDAELFAQAGVVPNGQPDKLGASQRVDAIKTLTSKLGVLVFSTVSEMQAGKPGITYTSTPQQWLKVQGENGDFTNYITDTSGDIDLGGGVWAKALTPTIGSLTRKTLSKPKDLSGLLTIDGKTVVITGDSLSYNRYNYDTTVAVNAYDTLHGIRSWPFLLRDYIHMNDIGFNYGDALLGVPKNGMSISEPTSLWQFGFNNRATILTPSANNSEYSFRVIDINVGTAKIYLHIGRIVGAPCQFDVYIDKGDGAGDVFSTVVSLPSATDYRGNDPIVVEIPYPATIANYHPKITFKNWLPVGGGAFVSGGCALMAVGTKHTPVYMTGRGGWTAPQIAADYANRIGQYNPDVLIVIAGANDRTHGDIASYTAGYRSIIEQTRTTNPECEIVMLGAMPATDSGYVPETAILNGEVMSDFLDVPKKLADEYGCIFVDNYRIMRYQFQDFLFDNVHLNRNGNTRLFRALSSEIMGGAIGNKEHLDGWSTYGSATGLSYQSKESHVTQAQIKPSAEVIITMTGGSWVYSTNDDQQNIINSLSIPSDGRLLIDVSYIPGIGVKRPFGLKVQIEQFGSSTILVLPRLFTYNNNSFTFIFADSATSSLYTTAELEGSKFKVSFTN